MEFEYLAHHGVKGMTWGVRRYQKKGGSYTRKGLKNYQESYAKYDAAKKTTRHQKTAYPERSICKLNGRKTKTANSFPEITKPIKAKLCITAGRLLPATAQ